MCSRFAVATVLNRKLQYLATALHGASMHAQLYSLSVKNGYSTITVNLAPLCRYNTTSLT